VQATISDSRQQVHLVGMSNAAANIMELATLPMRRYAARRKSLAAAAPELRAPLLVVPPVPLNKTTLSMVRFVTGVSALTVPAVRLLTGRDVASGPGISASRRRLNTAGVDVLVQEPTEHPALRPGVLWLHGGGMVSGNALSEASLAGGLVTALGAVAVSPDYRLAPENPFPAGLDDCMATLQWMVKHSDELGIDPDRIAVCGGSAGGGLAAAVAQRAFDEGISVCVQGLIYPMLDDRTTLHDNHHGKGELTWSAGSNRWAWTAYLGREPRLADAPEYAAPARRSDLAGLPPTWIGFGDLDVFHDENVAYAEKLTAAGVPCKLVTVPGMYHGADGIARKASSMQDFYSSMVEFLRSHLEPA
jgi:acetyl esterase/lipase